MTLSSSVLEIEREPTLCEAREVLLHTRENQVPRSHCRTWSDPHGSREGAGHSRMEGPHQFEGITLFPWFSQLLSEICGGLVKMIGTLDRVIKEGCNLDVDR